MDWSHLDTAAVCAAYGAVSGWFVPRLVAAVPEPDNPAEDKVPYAELAARPGLAWRSALAGALAAGLVGLGAGWVWGLLPVLFLVPVGVALAYIDFRVRLLPTLVIVPAYAVVLVLVVAVALLEGDPRIVLRSLVVALFVRAVFWLLWRFTPGMGFGDVRLSGLLALALACLGLSEALIGIYAGFVVGVLGYVPLRLLGITRTRHFPFGPFMLLGAIVGVLWGPAVAVGLGYGSP
jgi:leader peptidase (prepilin peptidase)/N-methyltransferase